MGDSRNIGVDILRGVVAYAIVLIHTPMIGNDVLRDIAFKILPSGNATFAVLAGVYMMGRLDNKEQDAWAWLKGRMKRILVPYLFWSTVYVLLNIIIDVAQRKPLLWDFSEWRTWGDLIFCGGGAVQLWFLIALFYVQVSIYVLKFYVRIIYLERYFLWLTVLIGCGSIYSYPLMKEGAFIRDLVFMFGYTALGISLSSMFAFMEKHRRPTVLGLTVLLGVSCGLMCAGLSNRLLSIINIACWIGIARLINVENLPRFLSLAGIHSMGIYLIHVIIISAGLLVFKLAGMNVSLMGSSVALALFFFFVSWGASMVLSRMKMPGM